MSTKIIVRKKTIKKSSSTTIKKAITSFRPRIRSRHPSHESLRTQLPKMPFTSVIRFGSTTPCDATVQINVPNAIQNSADKLRMKGCFQEGNVKTALWEDGSRNTRGQIEQWARDKFPIVTKTRTGSRGRGNTLIKTALEFSNWLNGKDLSNYIFEKFYNYNREYRLHITEDGCFYTCRKMLKENTPQDQRWFRNDSNSVWIREENASFQRPTCWEAVERECVKALKSCGLDFGACDVRVQSANDDKGRSRKEVDFIIVEINSAPSFGDITREKYIEMLPKLLTKKFKSKK